MPPRVQPEPEDVDSLTGLTSEMKYEVSLTFSGAAGDSMGELMVTYNAPTPNDLAKRAIALLLSAQGKDILLRDQKTGATRAVQV